MSRKSFQLLVQGTIPSGDRDRIRALITTAVEKALLPLDRELIWIGSQEFVSYDPTNERPAFGLVVELSPSPKPSPAPSAPDSSASSPSDSLSPGSDSATSGPATTP